MEPFFYLYIFIIHMGCVAFCQNIAAAKKFSPIKWGFGGLIFGLIALIAIIGMPSNK